MLWEAHRGFGAVWCAGGGCCGRGGRVACRCDWGLGLGCGGREGDGVNGKGDRRTRRFVGRGGELWEAAPLGCSGLWSWVRRLSAVSGVRAEYVETRELKLVRVRRVSPWYHSSIELLVLSAVLIFKPVFTKLLQHLPHIPPTPLTPTRKRRIK